MRSKIKIKDQDWYGINHSEFIRKFDKKLKFIRYMSLDLGANEEFDVVAAVYKSSDPDRSKGHKDYVLLYSLNGGFYISGMDSSEIKKQSIVSGVLCTSCNTALFSLSNHNYHGCGCSNQTTVDGGKFYLRIGAKDLSLTKLVNIDLLTGKVSLTPSGIDSSIK